MSQSFNLAGPSVTTTVQLNGSDCTKIMLNGVRIWERYTAQHQVWVSSGHNSSSTVWEYRNYTNYTYHYQIRSTRAGANYDVVWAGVNKMAYWGGAHIGWGIYSYARHGSKGIKRSHVATSWIDTSAYQTQNYTAYYA